VIVMKAFVFAGALALGAALFAGHPVHAQYPAKPVRVIVPFAPGGGTDILGRIVSAKLSEQLGQQFLVDNRPGAAGNVGLELTVKAPPDGHTLLVGSSSEIGIGPSLYPRLAFDVQRDLVVGAALASTPMVLVVHPSLPVKTAKDLADLARARPGQINYASAGTGTGNHMSAEMFLHVTQTKMTHISYKGAGPALTDVVGGQVHVMFSTLPAATALIKASRLKALAVSSPQRAPSMAAIPTMLESGLPNYEVEYWYGFFAPAATPREVLARINSESQQVLRGADTIARLAEQGLQVIGKTPEQFTAFVKADIAKWATVVKASGVKLD
jgi:tripartite-type tricarboxylate transporter receptor subunit TctC